MVERITFDRCKKIKYPYGKYNCWFPNHPAQQFPYHSALGCSQSPKKTNSGFYIIATECRSFKSNLSILYYTHNPQTLFMLILRVENSVSLRKRGLTFFWPYHCSFPEKPQSLLRQEDPGHRCVDQERASVPLRLPGRRNSITRGLVAATELSYSFPSWSIHRPSVRLWGQEDMSREAKTGILSHVNGGEVEYRLIKHCWCRHILELQQIRQ